MRSLHRVLSVTIDKHGLGIINVTKLAVIY